MNTNTTDFTEALFLPLKGWVETSNGNWNILIGAGFLAIVLGVLAQYVMHKLMGEEDERTKQVTLNSLFVMLCVVILCDIVFPKDFMWQIFFLFKYALAFLASAAYLAYRWKKDRT